MTAKFQLVGLARGPFEHLLGLSDDELRHHGAVRRIATEKPGFPCRISLEDAEIGEELLLLAYMHQPASSPYRASGPIFIRRNAEQGSVPAGEIPDYVSRARRKSLKARKSLNLYKTCLEMRQTICQTCCGLRT